jgi:hypothetical protein
MRPLVLNTNGSLFGRVLIGAATDDGSTALQVAGSGALYSATIYNPTASTGITQLVVQSGAGQGAAAAFQVKSNAGSNYFSVQGNNGAFIFTGQGQLGGIADFAYSTTDVVSLRSTGRLGWSSGALGTAPDVGIARNAAGVLEINTGTAGSFASLKAAGAVLTGNVTAASLWATGSTAGDIIRVQPGDDLNADSYGAITVGNAGWTAWPFVVYKSGRFTSSSGLVYNSAASAVTYLNVRAGAGQSTSNLFSVLDNAGSALATISSAGRIKQMGAYSVPRVETGTAAPSGAPNAIGDIFIDTSGAKAYLAKGTGSSADWMVLN